MTDSDKSKKEAELISETSSLDNAEIEDDAPWLRDLVAGGLSGKRPAKPEWEDDAREENNISGSQPETKTVLEIDLRNLSDETKTPEPVVKPTLLELNPGESLREKVETSSSIAPTRLELDISALNLVETQPEPGESIAPTRLEMDISAFSPHIRGTDESKQSPRLRRISCTMLQAGSPARDLDCDHNEADGMEPVSRIKSAYIPRTMLDTEVLFSQVSLSINKKEEKAREESLLRSAEPEKPFDGIVDFKMARPCAWTWDDPYTKERLAYCEQCGTQVYNFEGVEKTEAEAIVYQRENLRKPKFFKRADGKFMTRDCPVQLERQRNFRITVIGLLLILIMASSFFLFVLQPSSKPEKHAGGAIYGEDSGKLEQKSTVGEVDNSGESSGNSASSDSVPGYNPADGSFHWEAGQSSAPPVMPKFDPVPADNREIPVEKTPFDDESGSFWEYSN